MKVEHFYGSTNAEVFFMVGRILAKGLEGEVEALKTLFKSWAIKIVQGCGG